MKHFEIHNMLIAILMVIVATGCHKDDTESPAEPKVEYKTTTINIDVILPQEVRDEWQPTIDWALENIASAQKNLNSRIALNLRYHDEDKEDLDRLAYDLTHPAEDDDTCHAIIGPYHSSNAPTILRYAGRNRLPVVMPTCTSSELQRTNARNTYAWFLTESDITQCEMVVTAAVSIKDQNIALLYTDDTYGQAFRDWIGYYAAEQQRNFVGMTAYDAGTDLTAFMSEIMPKTENKGLCMCFALSNAGDYSEAMDKVRNYLLDKGELENFFALNEIFTDVALDATVVDNDDLLFTYGLSPMGSPVYGFPQSYEARFGKQSLNGFANVYDALTLIALGAAHQQVNGENCKVAGRQVTYNEAPFNPTLTDHIRSVVACESGATAGWNLNGLTLAFSEIAAGKEVSIVGATGSLNFDEETHTKILNTNYMLWTSHFKNDGTGEYHREVKPLVYLSTEGSSTQASTTTLWQMDKKYWSQTIEDIKVNHNLPPANDRWAVVISPSTTWSNYRHQADAFAMYQLLRSHGYDDEHIVLIVEDNLADDSRNIYPGQIFVERSDEAASTDKFINDDVRRGAVVDYHFSDLKPDDLADIMLGRKSDRLPHVIDANSGSDVLFFWSGHGGSQEGPLWGNEDASQYFGRQRIKSIIEEMDAADKYRRILFAIETCYSGKWGEALEGLPDVLVMTAATSTETSKADMYDSKLGVYLSNAFARTFRRQIAQKPNISIYNLYRELFRTTKGSHVSIYNQTNYGSVYEDNMQEYFQ